jgi:hypothetical protein
MAWTLEHSSKLRVIELVCTGRTTGLDLREATSKAIALGKEQGSSMFLVDATEIELTASTFDLYDLPGRQYPAENLARQSHVAVVLPKRPKERKDAEFYETACVNRGWLVKLFPNRDEGIEWLTGTDSSNKPDAGDA